MNNKKILAIVFLVAAIVVLIAVFSGDKNNSYPEAVQNNLATSTLEETASSSSAVKTDSKTVSPAIAPNPAKDSAWAVFQKYLGYNKNHDLAGVKSIVYKANPVCDTTVASEECKNRMDMAYAYGSALKKENFVNIWSDNKQTILAANFKIDEDDTAIGRNRAIIFFVNEGSGLKLLSFSPFQGEALDKASSTREALLNKLAADTLDSDQDGLSDLNEQCLSATAGPACVKTNPNLRDSNGNGFWDGVEALMK